MSKLLTIKNIKGLDKTPQKIYCMNFIPLLESVVTMLASTGGVGKSFTAIRLAMEFVTENPSKRVALWLTEDPETDNRRRMMSILDDFDEDAEFFAKRIGFITNAAIKFNKMEDGNAVLTEDFFKIQKELAWADLIIIDPLLQFSGCDENSNTFAGVLMGGLKEWAGTDKKCIVLIHHVTLIADQAGKLIPKARGAGEWQNGCRCVYAVGFPYSEVSNKPDKASQFRVFEMTKDNGIGYRCFTDENGEKRRTLRIFPKKYGE